MGYGSFISSSVWSNQILCVSSTYIDAQTLLSELQVSEELLGLGKGED